MNRDRTLLLPNTRLKLAAPSCCGGSSVCEIVQFAPQLKRSSLGRASQGENELRMACW